MVKRQMTFNNERMRT